MMAQRPLHRCCGRLASEALLPPLEQQQERRRLSPALLVGPLLRQPRLLLHVQACHALQLGVLLPLQRWRAVIAAHGLRGRALQLQRLKRSLGRHGGCCSRRRGRGLAACSPCLPQELGPLQVRPLGLLLPLKLPALLGLGRFQQPPLLLKQRCRVCLPPLACRKRAAQLGRWARAMLLLCGWLPRRPQRRQLRQWLRS